ncbi:hypothetical protein [Lewinella sp. W8]|uniref:hypothetical protein n=1 Tax=Lewinella sp. W8 TaxID=2528208 RepID=UPI0014290B67|nr:hypothetical protein [Lewinella sp. W8]MTB53658.1 hypothetical protein [Lewinella sp. W8]
MNKILKRALFILAILVLAKGMLFRATISYTSVGQREYQMSAYVHGAVMADETTTFRQADIDELIDQAQDLTAARLRFTFDQSDQDPESVWNNERANCIGYAALFRAILQEQLNDLGLSEDYTVEHHVGKLYFLGLNLHSFLDHPFFRDHDYNVIRDADGTIITAIDVSVYDYIGIARIHHIE